MKQILWKCQKSMALEKRAVPYGIRHRYLSTSNQTKRNWHYDVAVTAEIGGIDRNHPFYNVKSVTKIKLILISSPIRTHQCQQHFRFNCTRGCLPVSILSNFLMHRRNGWSIGVYWLILITLLKQFCQEIYNICYSTPSGISILFQTPVVSIFEE